MQQPATKDQCAEALKGYQDSVGLSGISTSKSNTPAATPNVSSSNFPYYRRSLTCCGGCLEDFCDDFGGSAAAEGRERAQRLQPSRQTQ